MSTIPQQFPGVTAVTKANVYFDGNVISHTLLFPDGSKLTLGLIFPGAFHFNTGAAERMEIVAGICTVKIDGQSNSTEYSAGSAFEVPAKSGFDISVEDGICEYICSFLKQSDSVLGRVDKTSAQVTIEVTLDCDPRDFDQDEFIEALCSAGGLEKSEIAIVSIRRGSTRVTVRCSRESRDRIIEVLKTAQRHLREFMVRTGITKMSWIVDGQECHLAISPPRVSKMKTTGPVENRPESQPVGKVRSRGVRKGRHSARQVMKEVPGYQAEPGNVDRLVSLASVPTDELRNWTGGARVLTVAVVFTDIINSTGLCNDLGDSDWDGIRQRHFRRATTLVGENRGILIKNTGDGLLALFHNACEAVKFAICLHDDTGHATVRIRAGTHVGQVSIDGDDTFGRHVNLTARIMGFRETNGVTASDRTKQDIAHHSEAMMKNWRWTEFQQVTLRGFTEPVTLWGVESAR